MQKEVRGMNYGADAADQIVRYSLDGVEHTLRISGAVAKNLAVFIAAVMKDQKKTRGRTRMETMLRERKPVKFFSVPKDRLREFAKEAKSKGLLYVIIRDKKHPELSEIMIYAEDAAKVNRVLDNMNLDYAKAESAQIVFDDAANRSQKEQAEPVKTSERQGETEQTADRGKNSQEKEGKNPVRTQTVEMPEGTIEFEVGENENVFDIGEIGDGNFTQAQEGKNLSGTSLRSRDSSSGAQSERREKRTSVRQELKEIKQEQAKKRKKTAQRRRNRQNTQSRKKRRSKGKGR